MKSSLHQHNIEVYRGYETSFDIYEAGTLLKIDVSHKILKTKNLWQEFLDENI